MGVTSTLLFLFLQQPSLPPDVQFELPGPKPVNDTSVIIVNQKEKTIIRSIFIKGNKVTKRHIIIRELSFREGDTISYGELIKKMEASKKNLLNTSLFNFVTIDTINSSANITDINISVAERWYTWPGPIFELADRNFNVWWETKDPERINYGFFLYRDNFRGRKERLTFYFKFGYTQQYGISYSVPYLDKRQRSGLGFGVSWSKNHEVNFGSLDNRQLFYQDPVKYIRRDFLSRINYTYRRNIYHSINLEARYFEGRIADTVTDLEGNYYAKDKSLMQYFTLDLFYRNDHRDSKAYPLKGYVFDAEIVQNGLGILQNEEVNNWNLYGGIRGFFKLGGRFYQALGVKGKISGGPEQPYVMTRGLGYRGEYIRGYEYYVIDGKNYVLGRAGTKFCIIKPRVKVFESIPFERFNKFHYALYAEAFFDAGYVDHPDDPWENGLTNHWQYGTGVGLNYVTYYDFVLRLEYSFNKLKEHGVFLHLAAPI
jgi:outer membrane protein assembly factor BamA